MKFKKTKILVAMSGGVDSAVTAALLLKKNYDCVGATMLLNDGEKSQKDALDAKDVCEKLGINWNLLDFRRDFEKNVIETFCESYNSGETPNPCITCNRLIKFGKLRQIADSLGIKYIATGHYARIERSDYGFKLLRGIDPKKDQSYMLCRLTQEDLSATLFPLGAYLKKEIRAIAASLNLALAEKPDSQDICFTDSPALFIEKKTGTKQGVFLDINGNIIGRHNGHQRFTIGQRKGIGLALGKPVYVLDKDARQNAVIIGGAKYLKVNKAKTRDFNWIIPKPKAPIKALVKLRYNQTPQSALIEPHENGIIASFDEPIEAPAPGQTLVAYNSDEVLGGGTLKK